MDAPPNRRSQVVAAVACCIVFVLAAVSILAVRLPNGRGAFDEQNYHLPAIRTFLADWPGVKLNDYLSATTPGYHFALTALAKVAGASDVVLRAGNLAFSVALVGLVAWTCAGGERPKATGDGSATAVPTTPARLTPRSAVVLLLPALCSMYVLFPGVWLLPDNAGWLGVFGVLVLALRTPFGPRSAICGGAVLLVLVLTRQIHLWAAGPLVVAAWMSVVSPGAGWRCPLRRPQPHEGTDPASARGLLWELPGRRVARSIITGLCTVPAGVLVLMFVRLWGGLVPPTFQGQYHEPNLAAPAFILSVLGVFGVFFAGWLAPTLTTLVQNRPGRLWLGACVAGGLLAAFLAPTTYSVVEGRFSGLWNLVRVFDERTGLVPMGRTSLVIVGLSTLGGLVVGLLVAGVGPRRGVIVLAILAAFAAAQAASFQLWQRYTEPFVLFLIPLLLAMTDPRERRAESGTRAAMDAPRARIAGALRSAGPLALAALCALVTAREVWKAPKADVFDLRPGDPATRAFIRGEVQSPAEWRPPGPPDAAPPAR